MIFGIGSDIIEISRIKKAGIRPSFLERVFTKREIELCRTKSDFFASLAVRFAAKEAVLKALGTGLRGCSWKDLEIIQDAQGSPEVVLSGGAQKIADDKGVKKICISLSHSRDCALAFCVAEGGGDLDVAGNC